MKNVYKNSMLSIAFIASISVSVQAQNVGIGTVDPDKSAVLDLQSADKGLLIPRMSVSQRDEIGNPANGLMIYQTDENSGFYFFNGLKWAPLSDNEAKSVATGDVNGWALDGNVVATGTKAAATAASYIGTPANIPLNFKIGTQQAAKIDQTSRNTLVGYESGKSATGMDNASIGYFALRATTTGIGNLGIGTFSLLKNIGGDYNVGIGSSSMQENLNGSYNIGIGIGALRSALGDRNVGVGVFAGFSSSGSNGVFLGNEAGRNETGSSKLYIANSSTTMPLIYGDFSAKFVSIGDVDPAKRASANTSGGYNLLVKGGILTEKVKVALASSADWADYVFEPSYNLMSLDEVEAFTKENKHLPNVPSAAEMAENGLEVAETSKMFMEKIEELTLYMIELNKEVKSLKAENQALKALIK